MNKFGEQFLHKKDQRLHTSHPIELEMERKKTAGEEVSQRPADKISDWLKVIERTHTGHREDPQVIERIRAHYYKENVIKPEDVPERTFILEQEIARKEGYGTIEITDEFREQKTQQIINNQKASLDSWVDYLSSPDSDSYPMWAKYWAFNSMLRMGKFEKVKKEEVGEEAEFGRFIDRKKDTVASFPTLNPRALAMAIGAIKSKLEEKEKPKDEQESVKNISTKLDNPSFQQLLSTENFSKLYAQFLIEMPEYSTKGLQETRGKWVKYKKGSSPESLVDSLKGYPLEWCTADIDTARTQLRGGDFYVYYSINEEGEAIIPRLAIRMQDDKIAENPRGIAHDQNLDPYIGGVLEEKLNNKKEFPNKEEFEKKSADMKLLTEIEKKTLRQAQGEPKQELTKNDLIFLYEINSKIEGFGYQRDPRIKELLDQRNLKEDALIVFDCKSEQIAYSEKELQDKEKNKNIKAYIGTWNPDVLKHLPKNIEHIYTKFPDQKVFLKEIIPDKEITSAKIAIKKLEAEGHQVSDYAKDILAKVNWKEKLKNSYEIVSFSVGELFGDTKTHTYAEIRAKAKESGLLDPIPANLAPEIRLNYEKGGQWTVMAMDAIRDRDDSPKLFNYYSYGSKSWLDLNGGRGDDGWHSNNRFFFARK